jgi:negative regulator of flagellin synthesis FlgM
VISVATKISGLPTSEPLAPLKGSNTGSVAAADKASTDTPAASTSTGDQVTLTTSARSLQKLSDAIAQTPVVDAAKVASIKQALAGGTYTINASSIADKMLQAERGLK